MSMGHNPVVLVLTVISCLSLSVGLTILVLRNFSRFHLVLDNAKGLTNELRRRQKESFERQSRYVYRRKKGIIYRLNLVISQAGLIGWLNAWMLILISLLLLAVSFLIIEHFICNMLISFYTSILFMALPYIMISTKTQINTLQTEKYMLYNMETVLNFISMDKTNILGAFNLAAKYFKPGIFRRHTEMFLFEAQTLQRDFKESVNIYKSIVNIRSYGSLLDSINTCHKIGGDYEKLVGHHIDRLTVLQKAKMSRGIAATGIRIAILVLIIANISFFFILKSINPDGYKLVTGNAGMMSFVFIAMFIVIYLGYNAGKLKI